MTFVNHFRGRDLLIMGIQPNTIDIGIDTEQKNDILAAITYLNPRLDIRLIIILILLQGIVQFHHSLFQCL